VGLRASYNDLLEESAISPRISMAYKVSKTVSFRGLWNFSKSSVDYIKYSKVHQFESESASHYILNFQYSKDNQTFRAETYYKAYDNLVKYTSDCLQLCFNNTGSGYAKGWIFFGDGKTKI
jgi:hypothetical protein